MSESLRGRGTGAEGRAPASTGRLELAALLRGHREGALLTQEELAERSGLSVRTIRDLEGGRIGRPRSGSLRLLAEALRLTAAQREALAAAAHGQPNLNRLPGPPSPSQLPMDVADFTGRGQQVQVLLQLLGGYREQQAVVISGLAGRAGVGKTALAVHVAHRLRAQFPDGQLYTNLRGTETRPADPQQVLAGFLRGLGIQGETLPEAMEDRASLYRSLLAGRQVLVVLDNAAGAAQIEPLLPGSPSSRVLVTSRARLTGLPGAQVLELDSLEPDQALALLARIVGEERVKAEPEAAAALALLCGHLPLALRIAGSKLAARPHWTLADLVARLDDERRRLDELAHGHLEVRASLGLSYHGLPPLAQALFRRLGLLEVPDLAPWLSAAVLETCLDSAREVTERLVEAQLIDVNRLDGAGQLRYRFHDLLRLYARERAEAEDAQDERNGSLARALGWSVQMSEQAAALLDPNHSRRTRRGDSGAELPALPPLPPLAGRPQALAWFEAERPNLVAIARQASATIGAPAVWTARLADALYGFFDLRSHLDDWEELNQAALHAAQGQADRHCEARGHEDLGYIAIRRHQLDRASAHLERALHLNRELGDVPGQARALNDLGIMCRRWRRYEDAISFYQESLRLHKEAGDRLAEGDVINNLGIIYQALHRYDEAVECYQQDLSICREHGDDRGEAGSLYNLAHLALMQDQAERAIGCFEQSLAICRQIGDRHREALNLHGLGEAHRHERRLDQAVVCYQESLGLYREVGERYREAETLWHLGIALFDLGERRQARERWQEALAMFEELRSPNGEQLRALLSGSQP